MYLAMGQSRAKTNILIIAAVLLGALVSLGFGGAPAAACTNAQSCSTDYQVNEAFFGNGGQLGVSGNGCSTSYCAKSSVGETGVGKTCGTAYCAQAGFNTDRTPYLQFTVGAAHWPSVGVLSSSATATDTATFSVKAYLASGYVVTTQSNPPQNGSYALQAMTSPAASSTGTEQFGINVVANSCPANAPASGSGSCSGSLGANPSQVPDSTFSFGKAAHNSSSDYYDQPNLYMYKPGDIIANSSSSSGETDYTISYIFNVSGLTPGGTYTLNQVLVATATY